jgi:predicted TIM-barrel fold metal-dependent hydrolase
MFIDVHEHVYKYQYPDQNGDMLFITLPELLKAQEDLEIDRAILLPVVSSEMYMPQSVGEIIDIANASNGRFVPYCNVDPRVYSNRSDAPIGKLLDYYRSLGCKGIGEVMPNIPWKDPRMQNFLLHAERSGFPLIFDMTGAYNEGYGIYDDPGMPQLEACLEKFPNLLFIGHGPAFWAEIAELKDPRDRRIYPKYPVWKEGKVAAFLRQYPNLAAELSAGSGANAMLRDPDYAVAFINEFHDRIMYGTDICTSNQRPPMAAFLKTLMAEGKISRNTFEAVARENAIRLLNI